MRKLGKCRRCKKRRYIAPHHIKPRSRGGRAEKRNLFNLCKECHDWAEEIENISWEQLTTTPSQPTLKKRIWGLTKDKIRFSILEKDLIEYNKLSKSKILL